MKVIVGDVVVEYQSEGSGAVILMLHGWKDSLHTFDALAADLSQTHRVVRVDLPGFGQSDRPGSTWDLKRYAQFVKDFCEKIQINPEVLAGHSFGGRVVIKGVAEGILTPRKVVLMSSAGIARKRTFKNDVLRMLARSGKLVTSLPPLRRFQYVLRRKLYQKIGSDYFASGGLKDTYLSVIAEDLQQAAGSITLPTLILWGKGDTSTPLSYGERFHALIQNSELRVFEGGHFLHQEKPHEVAAEINSFI